MKKIAARSPPLSEPRKVQLRRPERERTDRALRRVVALGPLIFALDGEARADLLQRLMRDQATGPRQARRTVGAAHGPSTPRAEAAGGRSSDRARRTCRNRQELALQEMSRRRPILKNRVSAEIETAVVAMLGRHPAGVRYETSEDRLSPIQRRRHAADLVDRPSSVAKLYPSAALQFELRLQILQVAEDRSDRARASTLPIADETIPAWDASIDRYLVPLLCMADVVNRNVVVLAPKEWRSDEGHALAKQIKGGDLALTFGDDPMFHSEVLSADRLRPPGNVASGEYARRAGLETGVDNDAAIHIETGAFRELNAGPDPDTRDDKVRVDADAVGKRDLFPFH